MCVYIYMHIYIYIYVYMYVCRCGCMQCIHIYIYIYIHSINQCPSTYLSTYVYIHVRMVLCVQLSVRMIQMICVRIMPMSHIISRNIYILTQTMYHNIEHTHLYSARRYTPVHTCQIEQASHILLHATYHVL